MKKNCSTCVFWCGNRDAVDKALGDCRRFPPTLVGELLAGDVHEPEDKYVGTDWPTTADDEWCGEWRKSR